MLHYSIIMLITPPSQHCRRTWNPASKCIHFPLRLQHHAWHGTHHDIGLRTRGIQWDSRSSGLLGEVCRNGGERISNVAATCTLSCSSSLCVSSWFLFCSCNSFLNFRFSLPLRCKKERKNHLYPKSEVPLKLNKPFIIITLTLYVPVLSCLSPSPPLSLILSSEESPFHLNQTSPSKSELLLIIVKIPPLSVHVRTSWFLSKFI